LSACLRSLDSFRYLLCLHLFLLRVSLFISLYLRCLDLLWKKNHSMVTSKTCLVSRYRMTSRCLSASALYLAAISCTLVRHALKPVYSNCFSPCTTLHHVAAPCHAIQSHNYPRINSSVALLEISPTFQQHPFARS
jgi:hypothetical protein